MIGTDGANGIKGGSAAGEKTHGAPATTADGAAYIRLEEVDSTNVYIRSLPGRNAVVTARRQTGGKGTKGRSFVSDEGGVYLTRRTFPANFPAEDAFLVMANASVAVCRTLEKSGLAPGIKWPNDIYVSGRKICGILIENTFSGRFLSRSIVGIGLNVNNDLPFELRGIAISMKEAAGHPFCREEVEETLAEETGKRFPMEEYLSRLIGMGEEAVVVCGDERIPVRLLSVDERGGLLAKTPSGERRFSAAEVSLRSAAKGNFAADKGKNG